MRLIGVLFFVMIIAAPGFAQDNDTQPPVVEIIIPEDGQKVSSDGFELTGTAEDYSGIDSVRISILDYGRLHKNTLHEMIVPYDAYTNIWSYSILSAHMTPRSEMRVLVSASDALGNRSEKKKIMLFATDYPNDNARPSVAIREPVKKEVDYFGFQFRGSAFDNTGISDIFVWVQDFARNEAFTVKKERAYYDAKTKEWYFNVLQEHITPGGEIKLILVAYDYAGNKSRKKIIKLNVSAKDV